MDGKQSTHREQDDGPRLQHCADGLPGLLGTEVPAPPSSFSQPHKSPAPNQSSQLEIRWAQGKGSLMNIHLSKVSTGCICADSTERLFRGKEILLWKCSPQPADKATAERLGQSCFSPAMPRRDLQVLESHLTANGL